MRSLTTTLDGDWRIRYRDPRRRRTVYLTVAKERIIHTQPPMPTWNNRMFDDICDRMRKRYPTTFQRQEWTEQLLIPTRPDDHEAPIAYQPSIGMVVVAWPGVTTVVQTVDDPDPLLLSADVARQCAAIQSRWSEEDERIHRTGSSVQEPLYLPGMAEEPPVPWGKHCELEEEE